MDKTEFTTGDLRDIDHIDAMKFINLIARYIDSCSSLGLHPNRIINSHRVSFSKRQLVRMKNLATLGMVKHAERGEEQEVLTYAQILRTLKLRFDNKPLS